MIRVACVVSLLLTAPLAGQTPSSSQIEFFEKHVRPVLAEHCYSCHGTEKQKADLRLDLRDPLFKPRDEGTIIVPGKPAESRLLNVLRHDGDVKMPPKGKLPDATITHIEAWIKDGAAWPKDTKLAAPTVAEAAKNHWAYQPVRQPVLPKVAQAAWSRSPIDRFIITKLTNAGLTPNAEADRRTLLRRLKFDLLGLPPTIQETEQFIADKGPDAYTQLVDKYLASPQFGERWGRYWLDVARYADTKGYVFQEERKYAFAYTYRDWVIKAFNDDLPFDQFVIQQLAADRLVAAQQAGPETQAAMGFLTLGRRFLNNTPDIIDDRIDVMSRGFMGLTVQCARCHDHKYDPIPTKDYYSLYGVFASSHEPKELPLLGEPAKTPEYEKFQTRLKEQDAEIAKFKEDHKKELAEGNRAFRDKLVALQQKRDQFVANSPHAPPRGMVLFDNAKPHNARVFLRGNQNNPGPEVARQFPVILAGEGRKPFTDGSGRLELARAIAHKSNPLTARVFVNRVWLHLLGAGLVRTPSDFGLRSDPPRHPELLDELAWSFMENGWSTKKLIRDIVLSQTYRQSSAENAKAREADPDNRLFARAHRRRLDFEAMRDGMLFVSGKLDLKMGGRPVEITDAKVSRRSVYAFIERQNLPGMFRTFDFAGPDATSPQRFQTTVPQQALFLLNSPFVLEQAKAMLKRDDLGTMKDIRQKIRRLYAVVFARQPDDTELRLGVEYIDAAVDWERYAQALLLSNEFQFVD
jgi:hypothetical protein